MHRRPRGARPKRRVMLVDAHVSSINTSDSAFMEGIASSQVRRAWTTSSRSCSLACRVFFEGEIPFVQLMPQSCGLHCDAVSGQSLTQLGQTKARLLLDPSAYHGLHSGDSRAAMPADLKAGSLPRLLLSLAHLIDPDSTDLQPPRNRRRTFSAIQRPEHPLPQILRIRLHQTLPSSDESIISQM